MGAAAVEDMVSVCVVCCCSNLVLPLQSHQRRIFRWFFILVIRACTLYNCSFLCCLYRYVCCMRRQKTGFLSVVLVKISSRYPFLYVKGVHFAGLLSAGNVFLTFFIYVCLVNAYVYTRRRTLYIYCSCLYVLIKSSFFSPATTQKDLLAKLRQG